MKDLASLGHKIILLIGDFTAKIGDPTGKDATRRPLSDEEIKENSKNYFSQVDKILTEYEVRYNSEWLGKISLDELIKLTSKVTVQQMIIRDMFQERITGGKPIGVHEFLYPLMQGYDSVAMEVDGEIGGNDQTFNMLMGRDLEKIYLNKDKMVLATPLLINSETGKKMSKSEGSLISIADSPEDIFGKTMRYVPDDMTKTVFELCTGVGKEEIEELQKKVDKGGNPKDFKERLAYELVKICYGEGEASKAREEFNSVYSKGNIPENLEEVSGDGVDIISFIVSWQGLSKSEAKRLIDQGGVSADGRTVNSWDFKLSSGQVIKLGPHKFIKVK
jgi:tyrosyl-tRNA synthetase